MKPIKIILTTIIAALALAACHTTEENYRRSYDIAVNKTRTGTGAGDYEAAQIERMRNTAEVDGDSVRVISRHFNVVDDSADVVMRYSVVVGEFKQKFNAMSFRDRLRAERQPSYVVFTGGEDRLYLVVAHGYNSLDLAAAYIRILDKQTTIKPTVPKPWVLERIE